MADVWTSCEACGLEYMGAHKCRAREDADPEDVVEAELEAWRVSLGHELVIWPGGWSEVRLDAKACAELSAAFGAIARRLREAGR